LERYKDFPSLVKATIDTKRKLGKDPATLAEIPRADSPDTVKEAWHRANGKPEASSDYAEYVMPVEITNLGSIDETKMTAFKEFAYSQNWNQAQFKEALVGNQTEEGRLARTEEGNKIINQMFLADAPKVKTEANLLLDKYGLEPLKMPDGTESSIKGELFRENPNLMQSPYLIMLMDKIKNTLSEDTLKGIRTGGQTGMTAEAIDTKIAEVRSQMDQIRAENPHNYKNNAMYKDLALQKTRLYSKKA
jgi:hypothetical protein